MTLFPPTEQLPPWSILVAVTVLSTTVPSLLDVVTIDKTGENFRLLYDVKGRFTVHRIMPEEAKVRRYPSTHSLCCNSVFRCTSSYFGLDLLV